MAQGDYLGIVMQSDIGAQGQNGVAAQSDLEETAQAATEAKTEVDLLVTPKTIGPTALASFDDGVDGAILGKCVVNIEPVQSGSGNPSPTNVRPISGWTGARVTVSNNSTQQIAIEPVQSGSGDPSQTNVRPISPGLSLLRDNGTTLDIYGGTLDVGTGVLTADREFIILTASRVSSNSATFPSSSFYINELNGGAKSGGFVISSHFKTSESGSPGNCRCYGGTVVFYTNDTYASANDFIAAYGTNVQFVYELATPKTYQLTPTEVARVCDTFGITVSQYDISFGEAGTVYGGTLDVGTGVLTVDKGYILFDGSSDENWEFYQSGSEKNCFFISGIPGKLNIGDDIISISNRYTNVPYCYGPDSYRYGAFCNHENSDNRMYFCQPNQDIKTVNEWKTWLVSNYVQLVYPLATPITYQLTPVQVRTLLGLNNIYADCGDVTVQYRGDVPNLYEIAAKSELSTWYEDATYPGCLYRWNGGVKEWLNPPIIPGNTYRTTERYNGKPVYKLVTTVSNPPKATMISASVANFDILIDNESFLGGLVGGPVPHKVGIRAEIPGSYESIYVLDAVGGGGGYNIWVDWSSELAAPFTNGTPFTLVIAYTKTTD